MIKKQIVRQLLVLSIACSSQAASVFAQTKPGDFDARARQIVSQMTLDEKIDQLHGVGVN
jgi:hypothetical protein